LLRTSELTLKNGFSVSRWLSLQVRPSSGELFTFKALPDQPPRETLT
jgi:hypothetical protein